MYLYCGEILTIELFVVPKLRLVRIPKDSEGFRRIPKDSEGFRRIPKDSEGFRRIL